MEHVLDAIRARRSVRTFDPRLLGTEETKKIKAFWREIKNPYEIPVTFRLLDAKQHALRSNVIVGAEQYVGAKVKRAAHAEEAFGYSFEMLVLYAQTLGLGTTWIGGTMDRPAFERAMELSADEMMPCASPLGHPAAKMSLREGMMRKGVKADTRFPFGELFFDADGAPLTPERAGALAEPLEAVRLAPSAVNKQPWRVFVADGAAHFYEKRSGNFTSAATGDLQKIDLGIALCHFALAAEETGLRVSFALNDPRLAAASELEYIASYAVSER